MCVNNIYSSSLPVNSIDEGRRAIGEGNLKIDLKIDSTNNAPSNVQWGESIKSSTSLNDKVENQKGEVASDNLGNETLFNEFRSLIDQALKMLSQIMQGSKNNQDENFIQEQDDDRFNNDVSQSTDDITDDDINQNVNSYEKGNVDSFAKKDSSGIKGGANTVPDRISSPQAATQMVRDVKSAGGQTLRIQMTHDQINSPQQMDKLKALVSEGDKQGVKIQFTFRDNANGGGGNILKDDKLQQAASDIKNVVKSLGHHPSFVLDTFNEGGRSATKDWADMQSTLIKSARDAGYKGQIVVEDSNWGGGLTEGGESGLMKYAEQLKRANGNNPDLIGSIHEYGAGSDATSRLTKEITGLKEAGFKPQIGEVGNANWVGGDKFEERDGAINAVKGNIDLLKEAGATVLPWMDQFRNGKIEHKVGFSKEDQF
ncbi:cellulase family glycosylhydrolase [Pantoea ananatis]|uniref:cellulase family glycosylhydrolase n=1 Tax=Pantoea ananas TaxID=553 RepID=UPI002223C746|nr:cellulase family glycosylhydrolase [Pantoea ananatis]MCW1830524.1 cellulase family glycosylhydrolase [Pantoea ananatis]